MQTWRYLFAAAAILVVIGVILQVFLAGVGLFGAGDMSLHIDFGYLVAALPALTLVLAWPARPGRQTVWLCGLLLLIAQVQTTLPLLRDDAPIVAALHPANALAVFWLSIVIARRALAVARLSVPRSSAPDSAASGVPER